MSRHIRNRTLYLVICGNILLQVLLQFAIRYPLWIEEYYSRGYYRYWQWVPKAFFSWVPFSVGDVFYLLAFLFMLSLVWRAVAALLQRKWTFAWHRSLLVVSSAMIFYHLFYLGWGLNYYRVPLAKHFELDLENISKEDYYATLDDLISQANSLSQVLDRTGLSRAGVANELVQLMKVDTVFSPVLSKTQVVAKQPISSSLVSYFAVTGYFNPFTNEVHVNQKAPILGYPFTVVHELAHQMGIGFEDECNFIAFQTLAVHPNRWYRYSAYYEAIQYFLRPIRVWDKERFDRYMERLDPLIKSDFQQEYAYWEAYRGWVNALSSVFYESYLQHNNQPEGSERYSMMNRLIIAWNKKEQRLN